MKKPKDQISFEPQRRLSPWRVLLAVCIVACLSTGSVFAARQWMAMQPATSRQPWFAPYVDVTAKPTFAFEKMGANRDAILSFVVSSTSDPCTPAWGSTYTLEQARATLDLDRRIARLRQQGGNVAVSFGGLKNHELAVDCTDQAKLTAAYKSVIDQYDLNTIDLDLEQSGLTSSDAAARRASAVAQLQLERRSAGKNLAVWVTLPVTAQGLSEDGTNAVTQLLNHHVDLAGVNVMTMDFGQSLTDGRSMHSGAESALADTERQLGILYERAGTHLNDATVWTKMGVTPMIGQNDEQKEVFSLDDAKGLNKFAVSHKVNRMSMWSANRDVACGGNYTELRVASDSCSGISQDKQAFAAVLGNGFNGRMTLNAGIVTTSESVSKASQESDDPNSSPYQIWSQTGAYLQGTKVVWRHNVYEAKWWTQGDMPDNPVLQTWQTPWELIGPVMPGEKPVQQATLPTGTYPEWSGTDAYDTGQRVLFKGVPYQAKWWNQGQSPAAATSNPDGSPWTPLTQEQINEVTGANTGSSSNH